jgi:pimeloyl-ACP methyl ester carboxylesterase
MLSARTVRGGTRLIFDAVEGVTSTVEAMHETIARHPLPISDPPAKPTRAHGLIAAGVYAAIRGTNALLREGADGVFGLVGNGAQAGPQSEGEIRALCALNGVLGDHLEDSGNTLAIPMTLLAGGRGLEPDRDSLREALPDARKDIVLLVHGLCLSELSWGCRDAGQGLGERLAAELPCTALHLRYNTGRHISSNGRELAALLELLCEHWPVELESISLVGHSMGGLVIRSACWYADRQHSDVTARIRRVLCLGTPHHGSMVERAGHAFDLAVRKFPYFAPFAVGRHRSAGIKDLHHGDLLDEDWQDHDAHRPREDRRRAVPMLPGVDYFFAAALLGDSHGHPLSVLLGDLLVRLDSATGAHGDAAKALPVSKDNCRIFCEKDHFDLLSDPRVHDQVLDWFRSSSAQRRNFPQGR